MDFLSKINAANILVAESDRSTMAQITDLLGEAGYNVQNAYFAGDALWALQHGHFDLALVDATMQDNRQRRLADIMDQFDPLPWIALIDGAPPDRAHLSQAGAADCLRRPFSPGQLLDAVARALEGTNGSHSAPAPPAAGPRSAPPQTPAKTARADEASAILERRLVEQQTLSALARSLSSVLDLDTLLTQVVEAAVSLTHAEEGLLLLPDEDEKALYIRAVKGIDSETARNFRVKTKDTLAGQVFHSGSPLLVGDQGWQKIKTEYLVQSLLYVPLSLKGETIGVLGVNNIKSDHTFTEHDRDLLQDLAAHAAIAIENARLFEESVQRSNELQTLVEASEAASSTLAIDRVLSIIANQLIGALGVAQCYTAEWRPEKGALEMLAVSSQALWSPADGPVRTVRHNPGVEDAFRHNQIVISSPDTIASDDPVADWLPYRFTAHSIVYVPLIVNQQPLGLITLYHIDRAVDASAYPRSLMTQIQQLALDTVSQVLMSPTASHQKALFRTAERALQIAEANWCEMALWNDAQQAFNLVVSYGEACWLKDFKPAIALERYPRLEQTLDAQTTFADPGPFGLQRLIETRYGKSVLGVPLIIKGQTEGLVLLVDTLTQRRFSAREANLAQALVLQAANALENARLFHELQLSLEELHRTQSKLVQTARLSAMGELAAAVAHQINNPLTTILVDTELILADQPADSRNNESLQAISRAGKRAHEVVRRLLTMARQQNQDDNIEPIDVNETIRNTLTLVKGHIQQGGAGLIVQLGESLAAAGAPNGQLEDVWLNLLINARDAVSDRDRPEIGIVSYPVGEDAIEVVVWDNGVGIPQAQHEQVFEPFFTTKGPGEGTGLGLHICRQIVEKCGGTITIESVYQEGTRFTIRLPAYHRRD